MNNNVKFDFTVKTLSGTPVCSFPSLSSTGNLNENTGLVTGTTPHSCEFEIPEEGDYTVTYSMTSGWAAVIVGNLKIVTAMSAAERYKGTFLRTLASAKTMYASIPAGKLGQAEAVALKGVIDLYDGLVSTAPSVYEAATRELTEAMEAAAALAGVTEVVADHGEVVSAEYYNLCGQRVSRPANGVSVARLRYADGSVATVKLFTR